MLCEECKKNKATVFVKEIINNKEIEFKLCENCAKQKGMLNFFNDPLPDFFTSLSNPMQTKSKNVAKLPDEQIVLKCKNCGLTYLEFMNKGKFGCSQCYYYFNKEIKPLLNRIHSSSNHVGKKTVTNISKISNYNKIRKFQEELQECIQKEDYETAAKLRDKIKKLKEEN